MTGDTYSSEEAASDAAEYGIAQQILIEDPSDADALETVSLLEKRYGEGFFDA